MLVLTRKKKEQIHIGDSIVITVLEVRAGKIRLGFDVPADLRILRGELHSPTEELPVEFIPVFV